MKHIFQLLDSQTGKRSPVFSDTREGFGRTLQTAVPADDRARVIVLVVVEDADNKDLQWRFSEAPAMRVDTFLKHVFPELELSHE